MAVGGWVVVIIVMEALVVRLVLVGAWVLVVGLAMVRGALVL